MPVKVSQLGIELKYVTQEKLSNTKGATNQYFQKISANNGRFGLNWKNRQSTEHQNG